MQLGLFDAKAINIRNGCIDYTFARVFYFGFIYIKAANIENACIRVPYIGVACTKSACIGNIDIRNDFIKDICVGEADSLVLSSAWEYTYNYFKSLD